ncbi:DUF4823 domain-containing protein [Pseudomonas sp. MYb185]|uniref:DUF4823 domain-containing protein n=1 Tax=Pseudomonas sp. MYb185 TaxID=1848729 RepID=UPI002113E76A|nr:DUF4823 domain-containing protein [Pseudomonas sp. MYb185]
MKPSVLIPGMMTILALLLLAGCTPSQMRDEGRYYLSDAGLLDNYQIKRSGNWRLQADSRLYIGQSHFVPVGHVYARPNILAEEAFAAAVQVFPMVQRAEQPLGLDQALMRTREQGLDYLLYTRFASAQSSAGTQPSEQAAQQGHVGRDRVVLQLLLMEASSERVIDFVTIESRTGFLAFYKSRPEDLLREPMQDYTRQLLGRP